MMEIQQVAILLGVINLIAGPRPGPVSGHDQGTLLQGTPVRCEVEPQEITIFKTDTVRIREWRDVFFPLDLSLRAAKSVDGSVALGSRRAPGRLVLIDSEGSARHMGRRGQGPGEFDGMSGLAFRVDGAVAVVDRYRVNVFSSVGEVLQSFTMQVPVDDWTWTPTNHIWIGGMRYDPQFVAIPLHRVDSSGRLEVSTGALPNSTVDPERPSADRRYVAARDSASVWAVRPDRYVLEHWTADGRLTLSIDPQREWFPTRNVEFHGLRSEVAPDPWVRGLHLDAEYRLWAALVRVSDRWAPDPERGLANPSELRNADYDTVIEVYDSKRSCILAQGVFEGYAYVFTGPHTGSPILVQGREDALGFPELEIHHLLVSSER